MFLTRPSPRLAIFIACYIARAGEGLGTRLQLCSDIKYWSVVILVITSKLKMDCGGASVLSTCPSNVTM